MTTIAPASASPLAMARPIPPVEPVTMAVLPERSMIMNGYSCELTETEGRQRGFHYAISEYALAGVLARCPGDQHQRQQMLLGTWWMTQPCRRRLGPVGQRLLALLRRGFDRLHQPMIELGGNRTELRIAIATHVVEAHAAADDQHAFIAQRRQCPTGLQVHPWVQVMTQRQLHHRDVRIGEHQFQR